MSDGREERKGKKKKKRVGASRVSPSRDPRCDGVIGYELTGAKGPVAVPRCGADLEGVNWSRGENRFITKRRERRRRAISRAARTTPWIRRCLFCACTQRFMLLSPLLPRPLPTPLSQRPLFTSSRAARGRREKLRDTTALPSYLRQTILASLYFSPSPPRLSFSLSPCIFSASSSTQKSRASAISGSPRVPTQQSQLTTM